MKVKLFESELLPDAAITIEEHKYLVKLLKQEDENLDEDLNATHLSETAIRLLNDGSRIVESLRKKLEGK